jgi:hypothetical protein
VRVVAVRALDGGYYARGIAECRDLATVHNIKVILLAGGIVGAEPGSDPQAENAVDAARSRGISVVAAAGNQPGSLDYPANYPGVLSVGAAGPTGVRCDFSASGRALDLLAPGCGLDLAHPVTGIPGTASGTSQAAAFTAATLAALRSHRPDLTPDEAEQFVWTAGDPTKGAPVLHVARAFHAAGLAETIVRGIAALPRSEPSVTSPTRPDDSAPPAAGTTSAPPSNSGVDRSSQALPAPHVRLVFRKRRLELRVQNRPKAALLVVRARCVVRALEFRRWVIVRRRVDRLRLPADRWDRLTLKFEGPGGRESPVQVVRLPSRRPRRSPKR